MKMGDSPDDDSDRVAKIFEEFDDLEDNLLRGSTDNKKVTFEDFDDDHDALDLLSDGSKNSKPLLSNLKGTKGAADLFKIKETESRELSKQPTTSVKPPQNDLSPEKCFSVDKSIANEPPKSLETLSIPEKAKKSSFIEDLFGSSSRASSLKDISKNPEKKNKETAEIFSESMPNLLGRDQGGKSNFSGFTLTSSSSRVPRRGRGKSSVVEDHLGFLTPSNAPQKSEITEKREGIVQKNQQTQQDDLPEWLGGTKKFDKSEIKSQVSSKDVESCQENSKVQPENKTFSHPEVSQLTQAQYQQQAALITLQQQEHELRAATALSQQSQHLQSIMSHQQTQLNEQERMFNMLVKKQVDKQAALDMVIKMQQAKIDHYIEALAKEPVEFTPTFHSEHELRENVAIESESLLNKLEMKNQNLENILDIIKEKHKREIKILEESHETQMHFMRSSMERLETKLREDTETLEKDYEIKIVKLVDEKKEIEEFFKQQIQHLKKEHKEIINEMHTRYREQIALLQKEHSETIENISRAKQLERQAVDFMQSNKTNLETILNNSKDIFDDFRNISDELKTKESEINAKKERDLIKQEEQLQVLREQLYSQQELLENERKQLMIATHNLKSETSQLLLQFQRNTELYNETETRLKMREQAFIKERELFQEQNKWERDHLQYLKEAWMTEQKRQMQQLATEREATAAEKAKLEVLSYLKTNSDDITKAELEAAIKAAHDATDSANRERKKWLDRIKSCEADNERIRDKEKHLTERARELENLTQAAILKREEGMRALKEAQIMEKQHRVRMSQLEMQLEQLAQRENKIATEKLSLARDRLAVKIHQDKPERDKTNDSFNSQMHQPYISQMQTHFRDIVDPQLLLLKLNLDNKLDTSNQLISDMQTAR